MKHTLFLVLFSVLLSGISSAQVGIGNANPLVNLDVRAAKGNSAIAFGNTNQTASAAGAGAMKYDNSTKQMYYRVQTGCLWQELRLQYPQHLFRK
ncbi:hypothetical protein J3D55_001206 [Chryseobacterium ginsenosidimutans]|uniref:hypothetical protein n=1 Tax=Chryseobacterium ginsenosidimutans TaxID=687846 RepID=UPI002168EFBB|nr:hypothetical protein [Chryseobacterium ginsenosidimutans]MCS3868290.1 hypothetical protein [Chryseobacterium ginsenosidimutans]